MKTFLNKALRKNVAVKNLLISLLAMLLGVIGLESLAPDAFEHIESVLGENQPGLYQVVEVNDGDTITVKANGATERVRFIGIDTPEKNHPQRPVQCFAEAATGHLEQLIGIEDVTLVADPQNSNRDRYDRLLRYVYLPNGQLLNQSMIEDGFAFAYLAFPFSKSDEFARFEEQAKAAGRGLWSACEIEEQNGYIQTNPV